jgi:hypothetical protein
VKARGDIPIILCCSEDDEPALAKVVDELLREGMAPELVPGVEFDANLLANAVDAAANGALFVLCISPALDKGVARKLSGLFSARSGRGQKIISSTFTPSRPLAILPAIRGALKDMRLDEDDEPLDEIAAERQGNLRDVVEAFAEPEPPPQTIAAVDAEALARELAMGMAEAEAILERRDLQSRAQPRPAPRRATPDHGAVQRGTPRRATPAPVSAPRSEPAPRARIEPVGGTIERRLEGMVPAVEALVTDGDPSRRIPRPMIPPPPRALADEPQGNRWLLAFAGIGIAGIVALALLQLFRPDEQESGRRGTGNNGVPASATDGGKRPVERSERDVRPEPAPTTAIEPEPAPTTAVQPEPAPPEPAPTTAVPGPTSAGEAVVVNDDGEDGGKADGGEVPPPPKGTTSKRDLEEAALALAVQEGKLARAGKLYVSRAGTDELTWADANGRCQGRRVNGIGGFHLPAVSDLKRLRVAKLVGSGMWWSRKKAAADEAIAVEAASGATHVYLTVEPAGRAICVRTL